MIKYLLCFFFVLSLKISFGQSNLNNIEFKNGKIFINNRELKDSLIENDIVYFANVKRYENQAIKDGRILLGVELKPNIYGLSIEKVSPNTLIANSKMKQGDVIYSINDSKLYTIETLHDILGSMAPNPILYFKFFRKNALMLDTIVVENFNLARDLKIVSYNINDSNLIYYLTNNVNNFTKYDGAINKALLSDKSIDQNLLLGKDTMYLKKYINEIYLSKNCRIGNFNLLKGDNIYSFAGQKISDAYQFKTLLDQNTDTSRKVIIIRNNKSIAVSSTNFLIKSRTIKSENKYVLQKPIQSQPIPNKDSENIYRIVVTQICGTPIRFVEYTNPQKVIVDQAFSKGVLNLKKGDQIYYYENIFITSVAQFKEFLKCDMAEMSTIRIIRNGTIFQINTKNFTDTINDVPSSNKVFSSGSKSSQVNTKSTIDSSRYYPSTNKVVPSGSLQNNIVFVFSPLNFKYFINQNSKAITIFMDTQLSKEVVLKQGDILVHADGTPYTDIRLFHNMLKMNQDKMMMYIMRNNRILIFKVNTIYKK